MIFFIQVIGNFVSGSGFESIIFQSDIMKSECIKSALSGSDYNHEWIVYNVMFEVLERLAADLLLN